MSMKALERVLNESLNDLKTKGTFKGKETLITGIKPAEPGKGPRYYIEGQGDKEFLKMNGNSYLGLSLNPEVIKAEEEGARRFGAGPGAVRFISGTYQPHAELEERLAKFHNREAAMIFSSAYSTVMGILSLLISSDTIVISDELNHNCIINAIRLSRPAGKAIYEHLNMADLDTKLKENIGKGKRVIVITDGIFSMRGDYAPLDSIVDICKKYDSKYEEGVITIVDDSHGVGSFGKTGRGVEEYTNTKADILVSTLGKALGVNGGYVVASSITINYLRETAPFYIYSNPITPSEAAASMKSLEILDSEKGLKLLKQMLSLTEQFEEGLQQLGFEIISSEHPVVPLMIRDTQKTTELVNHLFNNGILATGLNYPVVPKGDEEIRFQIAADQTENDIDYVLGVLKTYKESH
ncbi:MAG: aminotransferase class I/II-fold pyridoxal phosphate-dependent enzyme [Deltaproteobacteria bacterium]|nr:aminotransferase class I/II-fold pyridoxal phosphate-dependent enzyme [Deltaproteobacteria bacterium]MCD6266395.1 aminotransferase class I/II-fold pyridoxal phosphate-dependent enzyme [Deltaproteobacteria bacterium]HDH86643.1 aminotransferase class I/II-fold pyridoxal phosphate-dependent enzyme [Desulfobacteraceae bacterium]